MNYENLYKNALEKAKEQYNKRTPLYDIEYIFPELKESEDERIRREIIDFLKLPHPQFVGERDHELWIAWLEKQGEQKHFSDFKAKDWYVSKVDGKIHNMTYNPTDKVEPKFKIGNWITDGRLTCKVLSVTGKSYELHLHNDDYCHFETDVQSVDKRYHLWTIQDAKDGDVLVDEDNNIGIYVGKNDDFWHSCIYLGCDGCIHGINVGAYHKHKNTKPATKEQRDMLFQKMKEAGYEWDAQKKELKKMKSKTLNADNVVKWLNDQACLGWLEDVEVEKVVEQFKKDFGL